MLRLLGNALCVLLTLSAWAVQAQVPPPCTNPSALSGPSSCGTSDYIVVFKDGTDAVSTTHALEQKYGFTAESIWFSAILGFGSNALTAKQVALLRCEPQVRFVERNLPLCTEFVCPPNPPDEGACPPIPVPMFSDVMLVLFASVLAASALIAIRR